MTTPQQHHQDNTYEATRARQSTHSQPDKITWTQSSAFRDNPYRLLHHQKGLIGKFRIQLLEAAELKRSYWSALALGPVKHLGLSKAHGPISSFAQFGLAFEENEVKESIADLNQKKRAKPRVVGWTPQSDVVQSPVISQNDNPVWQSCEFELPLRKGSMPRDGMPILLQVRMDEDVSAAENVIPVGVPSPDERLLGTGSLDISSLCLGTTLDGSPQVSVMEAWIPLELKKNVDEDDIMAALQEHDPKAAALREAEKQQREQEESCIKGRVRVLVSYTPYGLEPRHNDWVAMEAFARRSPTHNGLTPLVPPMSPFRVMDVCGSHLLLEYTLPKSGRKATMRLHRNAVFVIERQNVVDGVVNLAMLPTDIWMSTGIGQSTARVTAPVVSAVGELVTPAVLTCRIIVNVIKTTALAGLSGVSAATGAAVAAATHADERRQHQAGFVRQERFV